MKPILITTFLASLSAALLGSAHAIITLPTVTIGDAGNPNDPFTGSQYHKQRTTNKGTDLLSVLFSDGGDGQRWLGERIEFMKTAKPIDGKAAAYVCEDFVCQAPETEVDRLRALLRGRN